MGYTRDNRIETDHMVIAGSIRMGICLPNKRPSFVWATEPYKDADVHSRIILLKF